MKRQKKIRVKGKKPKWILWIIRSWSTLWMFDERALEGEVMAWKISSEVGILQSYDWEEEKEIDF